MGDEVMAISSDAYQGNPRGSQIDISKLDPRIIAYLMDLFFGKQAPFQPMQPAQSYGNAQFIGPAGGEVAPSAVPASMMGQPGPMQGPQQPVPAATPINGIISALSPASGGQSAASAMPAAIPAALTAPHGYYQASDGTYMNNPPATPLEPAPDFSMDQNGQYYTPDISNESGVGIGGLSMSPTMMGYNEMFNKLASSGIPEPQAAGLAADYAKAIDKNASDDSLQRAQIKAAADIQTATIRSKGTVDASENAANAKKYQADQNAYIAEQQNKTKEIIAKLMADTSLTRQQLFVGMKLATTPIDAFGTIRDYEDVKKGMAEIGSAAGGTKTINKETFTPTAIANIKNMVKELRKKYDDKTIRGQFEMKGMPPEIIDQVLK